MSIITLRRLCMLEEPGMDDMWLLLPMGILIVGTLIIVYRSGKK